MHSMTLASLETRVGLKSAFEGRLYFAPIDILQEGEAYSYSYSIGALNWESGLTDVLNQLEC
jgi:hypothetical protein